MPTLHVLKVFVDFDGEGGNPLGVFLDGREVAEGARQGVAADLGFSETVFVDDPGRGELRIFTPAVELPFAGHPLVGTAWLLRREGFDLPVLCPPAGEVAVRFEEDPFFDGGVTHVLGDPGWAPPFEHVELGSPREVRDLAGPPGGCDLVGVWAWDAEMLPGIVYARVFAPRLGVEEDEATGSYAMRLAAKLGEKVTIYQGRSSMIQAEPLSDGTVEIGGYTKLVEVRELYQEHQEKEEEHDRGGTPDLRAHPLREGRGDSPRHHEPTEKAQRALPGPHAGVDGLPGGGGREPGGVGRRTGG